MLIFKGNFDVESDFRMDRILIIDDDEELCELVSEYLEVEGFNNIAGAEIVDGRDGP